MLCKCGHIKKYHTRNGCYHLDDFYNLCPCHITKGGKCNE